MNIALHLQSKGGETILGGQLTTEGAVTSNNNGTTRFEGNLKVGDNDWTPTWTYMNDFFDAFLAIKQV